MDSSGPEDVKKPLMEKHTSVETSDMSRGRSDSVSSFIDVNTEKQTRTFKVN